MLVQSTAQSLPPDVIRETFKYFSSPFLVLRYHRAATFPWYLGHVCSLWRAVFLSMTPEFWSNLVLGEDVSPETSGKLVDVFLERSRGLPFSFEMRCHGTRSVLDRLIAESARWKDVQFHAFPKNSLPLLMPIKDRRLPLLRSLCLSFPLAPAEDERGHAAVPESCRDVFMDAPHLTHLTLFHASTWQFNWSLLTSFELMDSVFDPEVLSIFPLMENLEKLSVGALHCDYETPITMPHLKSLAVRYGHKFLKVLKTPSLEHLYLGMSLQHAQYAKICSAACISLIQESSCRLAQLGIPKCTVAALEDILPLAPEIQYLTLPGSSDILEYLGRSQSLFLKSLRIRLVYPGKCDIKLLENLVSVSRFQELVVSFPNGFVGLRTELEELKLRCDIYGTQFRIEVMGLI